MTLAPLLLVLVTSPDYHPISGRFTEYTALTCTERDEAKAKEMSKGKLHLRRPNYEPSCIRCLAPGLDGKPVELDPRVCDTIDRAYKSLERVHSLIDQLQEIDESL
jgi:hypothetical protein